MPVEKIRGTNFTITCNNWTQEQYDLLQVYITTKCSKGIIAKEQGAEGTPHLQCALVSKCRIYFDNLRSDLGTGFHLEVMKKPWLASKRYCTKEDKDAFLFETQPPPATAHQGLRSDLLKAKAVIQSAVSWTAILDNDELLHIVAKHGQWCEKIWANRPFPKMDELQIRYWQYDIIQELIGVPDTRKIIWFNDQLGGRGKSYLARLLCCNYGAIEMPNKTAEIYYLYQGQPIIIWDLARTVQERVPYEPIEKVKNGSVVSTKYTPQQKIFAQPHVVVFANYAPNESAWTPDRYDIREHFNVNLYTPCSVSTLTPHT